MEVERSENGTSVESLARAEDQGAPNALASNLDVGEVRDPVPPYEARDPNPAPQFENNGGEGENSGEIPSSTDVSCFTDPKKVLAAHYILV
jgi:hypothetical protein